jgi:hypothetical protein
MGLNNFDWIDDNCDEAKAAHKRIDKLKEAIINILNTPKLKYELLKEQLLKEIKKI